MRISGYYDIESQWFMEWHYPVSAILIHNYYVYSRDHRSYARVILAALIIIAITAIVNIYVLFRYPEVARQLFGEQSVFDTLGPIYFVGLATYAFTSGVPFIIPMLVAFYRIARTGLRIVIVILLQLFLYQFYVSSNCSYFDCSFLFAFCSRRSKETWCFCYRVGNSTVVYSYCSYLSKKQFLLLTVGYDYPKDLSTKMRDIGYVMETGIDTSNPLSTVEGRAARMPLIIQAFARNPIFGRP